MVEFGDAVASIWKVFVVSAATMDVEHFTRSGLKKCASRGINVQCAGMADGNCWTQTG